MALIKLDCCATHSAPKDMIGSVLTATKVAQAHSVTQDCSANSMTKVVERAILGNLEMDLI
jgi:hypothetical protein